MNRLLAIARWWPLGIIILLVIAALGAGIISDQLGFTYDEIHPRDALLPSGALSIPDQGRQLGGSVLAFNRLDPDGDGRVSVAEAETLEALGNRIWRPWKAALTSPSDRLTGIPLKRLASGIDWASADGNGDGRIDHSELVRFSAPLALAEAELSLMDGNGDGYVYEAEYRGAPLPRAHLLGTDALGRDVAVRLLYGLRVTLLVALCATAIAFVLGSGLGLVAGLRGGLVDRLLMRGLEVAQAVPFVFVVILLSVAARENLVLTFESAQAQALAQGVVLFCALGLIQWFSLARYARGLGLSLRKAEFVKALSGMGVGQGRLVRDHLLPNAMVPLLAFGTLLVPTLVLEEAFLSFLGFGVQPPFPSLGILLNDGVAYLEMAPTLLLGPALVLLLLTWALHLVAHRFLDRVSPGGKP